MPEMTDTVVKLVQDDPASAGAGCLGLLMNIVWFIVGCVPICW